MATKKRGLGKGLSALIPEEPMEEMVSNEVDKNAIVNIDISLIKPNKNQPRKEFDKQALEELKHSIKDYGVIQPIIVRKKGEEYEIVAGERRWHATKNAGLEKIPCIIKDVEEVEATKLALIENIQREDLNSIEEAKAFDDLMKNYGYTQEEVARIIGKSRSYIANTIRLLNLEDKVRNYVVEGKLSSGHGRALLAIEDEENQIKVAERIVKNKLNVRDTEKLVKDSNKPVKKEKVYIEEDPFLVEIEESLMNVLGTRVSISSGREKGKIEIEYYGDEDLERILEMLLH
ncbi:MAG TPA: ParB/RepB/Spo0J family partition protein [Tissierellales bacterium]|nr:ParB/RepB/Spo0J family partition protein [Tissierellales bacterium]